MARKRRSRLTVKKKKKNPRTPGGLNQLQFAALAQEFSSFQVEDEDSEPLIFSKGEIAYVHWQYSDDPEKEDEDDSIWIGRIDEIRANDPHDVWVKICWYWSPHEVAQVIDSFDPSLCGKKEKLFSDNVDFLSVHCFVGHAEVKYFDETSIHQGPIGEDEWFRRYTFMYEARKTSSKMACPLCQIPYSPAVDEILHFCPRRCCRVAYHQACLVDHGYVDEEDKKRNRRLLETWPDLQRSESVESVAHIHPPRKCRKLGRDRKRVDDPLACFPSQLIAVAEQQIVRGTKAGGIVGNVAPVCAARQLVYDTLASGGTVPADWEKLIDISAAFPVSYPLPNCYCPHCHSPI